MLPTHRPPTHPGEMLLKEFLEPLGVSQAEAATRMSIAFPAAEWDRQGPSSRQRGHSAATRRADGLGRTDLADTAGQVGPVARAEGPGAATEGPPTAQDSIVTATAHAARISQLRKSSRTASHASPGILRTDARNCPRANDPVHATCARVASREREDASTTTARRAHRLPIVRTMNAASRPTP